MGKLLVIDDSKLVHKIYDVVFGASRLVHAYNGKQGLEQLLECGDVEAIFVDLSLPEMHDYEFLRKLKSSPSYATIPVILVATDDQGHSVVRGMELGAAACVKKPFQNGPLLDLVDKICRGN